MRVFYALPIADFDLPTHLGEQSGQSQAKGHWYGPQRRARCLADFRTPRVPGRAPRRPQTGLNRIFYAATQVSLMLGVKSFPPQTGFFRKSGLVRSARRPPRAVASLG